MAYADKKTVFPNGINRKVALFAGGTAGALTCSATFGVAVGDVIDQVVKLKLSGALIKSALDLTSEFTNPIAAANTVANTGGSNTTGAVLFVYFADQNPNA